MAPPFDAGPFTGDGGNLTWTAFIDAQATTIHAFTAIAAFGPNDVWLAARAPAPIEHLIFHFDGGNFVNVLFADDPPFTDLEVTRAPRRRLAIAHGNELFVCDRDDGGCFAEWDVRDAGGTITGLCSDGVTVFGAGKTTANEGALFRESALLRAYPTAGPLFDCHVRADGMVLGSGTGKLAMYQPADGGDALLDVTPNVAFTAIHGVGYQVFLTGPTGQIVEARYDGTFSTRYTTTPLRALAGRHPSELFAGGDSNGARFDGGTWVNQPPLGPNIGVLGLTAASDNTYFAVGVERDAGQFLRGRR